MLRNFDVKVWQKYFTICQCTEQPVACKNFPIPLSLNFTFTANFLQFLYVSLVELLSNNAGKLSSSKLGRVDFTLDFNTVR